MSILEAIILGIVQGLAEFLPISSSGHLVLFQSLFKISEPMRVFDIILHLGTLIPILFVYRKDLFEMLKNPFQKYNWLLVTATIPAVIFTLLFDDIIDASFETTMFLPIGFVITGILLLISDNFKEGYKKGKDMSFVDAILIGTMQAVAIVPGISRSGSTISGALFRNLKREDAAKFSFMMSIPIILGAVVLEVIKMIKGGEGLGNVETLPIIFGFLASMITGYLAITFMLRIIKKNKLRIFSYYVFGLAVFVAIINFIQ